MKKSLRRFTLVEMLTVVAIIGILAGLIIPTVALSQQRGRITQAKSDITSLMTALKGLDSDYNKILNASHAIGNQAFDSVSGDSDVYKSNDDGYDAMIAELSVPKNGGLTVSVNKRKRVYLDPKSGFDPSANYNTDDNQKALWRDPWGNRYQVYVNINKTGEIKLPGKQSQKIAADIAIYSCGPNGTDDKGCNVELDECISSGTHKNHDDVASWRL